MDSSMMSTRESAESNAEPTKSTTSTQENAIVLKDTISSKESALNANLEKPIMNTLWLAPLFLARESTNTTHLSPRPASASQNMFVLEEPAPTAILDTTMTPIQIDVFANLDILKRMASATQFAPLTRLMSMENANATMDFLFGKENVLLLKSVPWTHILMSTPDAVYAMMDTPWLEEDAAAINTVDSMDTLNTDNATAMMDTSGSWEPAEHAEPMKDTMALHASATSASPEMLMETALSQQPPLNAISMKDMMKLSRLVFALMELNTSEEDACPSLHALKMLIITVLPASATQDSNFLEENV